MNPLMARGVEHKGETECMFSSSCWVVPFHRVFVGRNSAGGAAGIIWDEAPCGIVALQQFFSGR
jgi:hypothetical protein